MINEQWANKIVCRYTDGHETKKRLRDGEDRVLIAEIIRLRAELSRIQSDRGYIVGCNEGYATAIDHAASTHESRVEELRNDPTSYKNGKIIKSAKRASDFHERSARAIRTLQSEKRS